MLQLRQKWGIDMIHNNLSVLMAKRNVKASRVSAETGISRSTLNSISNNSSKMIQMETINTLCSYLKVEPNDFFSFSPIDFSFNFQFPLTKPVKFGSDGFGGEHWWVKLLPTEGDLFITATKNFQKLALLELTFSYKGVSFEGVDDRYDFPLRLDVNILDNEEKTFQKFWDDNNLTDYYTILSNQIRDAFIKSLASQKDVAYTFDTYGLSFDRDIQVNISSPVLPF